MKKELSEALKKRIRPYLIDTDDCIIYPVTNHDGYAEYQYTLNGKNTHVLLHRYVYSLYHSVILDKYSVICHTCDVPNCINPKHLFLGTHADNVADKVAKGRQAKGTENGRYTTGYYSKYAPVDKPKPAFEALYGRSLAVEQVRYIKERIKTRGNITLKDLSAELGIPYQRIRDINCGRVYSTIN